MAMTEPGHAVFTGAVVTGEFWAINPYVEKKM
jgi:hypothetical protein